MVFGGSLPALCESMKLTSGAKAMSLVPSETMVDDEGWSFMFWNLEFELCDEKEG